MATSEKKSDAFAWIMVMVCVVILGVELHEHRERLKALTARVTALESREGQASGN